MTTAPEAHENSAPCQREVLRARGHLERVHAGQARRVRHEAVVQVDICVQTPPPCRCSCTAVHCHATLKCLAQGMQAACKAEARACVLHAAQRDLVLDLLRAQPLGALAHDEAVDLHAGKKGSARVSGFFFFFSCCYPQHAAPGTLPQVRRTASKPAPAQAHPVRGSAAAPAPGWCPYCAPRCRSRPRRWRCRSSASARSGPSRRPPARAGGCRRSGRGAHHAHAPDVAPPATASHGLRAALTVAGWLPCTPHNCCAP